MKEEGSDDTWEEEALVLLGRRRLRRGVEEETPTALQFQACRSMSSEEKKGHQWSRLDWSAHGGTPVEE